MSGEKPLVPTASPTWTSLKAVGRPSLTSKQHLNPAKTLAHTHRKFMALCQLLPAAIVAILSNHCSQPAPSAIPPEYVFLGQQQCLFH